MKAEPQLTPATAMYRTMNMGLSLPQAEAALQGVRFTPWVRAIWGHRSDREAWNTEAKITLDVLDRVFYESVG